ncbi:MAG: BamA/TamA family outer membrane protein [Myxococcota bacterium]|nr:BamA/TamA family outer membrane protein [Deltaproteobacteria bacterium]MDQ3339641.1 BamA/TamA family outer membrane protein [Myxococcota bacterium]
MTAKQTTSASLGALLSVLVSPALADDDPVTDEQPAGEVQPKKLEMMPKRTPTGTFSLGAGYSTDEGFMAMTEIYQPRLFGTDKGLRLRTVITERRIESLMRYEDPTLFDAYHLRADLYNRTKVYKEFKREAAGGEITLGQRIAPNLDFFVGYKLEHAEVGYGAEPSLFRSTTPVADDWGGGGMIGALRFGVNYSTIAPSDSFYPMRGTTFGATLEVADRRLGSDIEYLRSDGWFGHHRGLGPFTLHLSGKVSSITDVPMSERLHFDGSSDVRGYAPGAIMQYGGNVLWTVRTELETPSVANLSLTGFFDAGGLHTHETGQTIGSVGVGLVWRSPIGPLRFDWAVPLSGADRSTRFIFGVGGRF